MKTIIGLIVFMLVVSVTKAQSLNSMVVGTWQVTADTIKSHSTIHSPNVAEQSSYIPPNNTIRVTAPAQKLPFPPKNTPPVNDIWKFTNDSLYYIPSATKQSPARRCTYTIKDSVVYCLGQPAYKIIKLTNTNIELASAEDASGAAGLYVLPNSGMVLYLSKYRALKKRE